MNAKIIDRRLRGLMIEAENNKHLWCTIDSRDLSRQYIVAELHDGRFIDHQKFRDLEFAIMYLIT